jgi:hypothetical protein
MSLLAATSPQPNNKLLATQWLAIYQAGPRWVPPLIYSGALANLFLAFSQPQPQPLSQHDAATTITTTSTITTDLAVFVSARTLHLAAAALTLSIPPITVLYLEPGINGACKWKVQQILREDGFSMPGAGEESSSHGGDDGGIGSNGVPGVGMWVLVGRHSASAAARKRAESVDMAELVRDWARVNFPRAAIGVVAGLVSFTAGRMAS